MLNFTPETDQLADELIKKAYAATNKQSKVTLTIASLCVFISVVNLLWFLSSYLNLIVWGGLIVWGLCFWKTIRMHRTVIDFESTYYTIKEMENRSEIHKDES